MAHRLLPFRQYDENDVVNLYALKCDNIAMLTQKPGVDGNNADGVLVQVENGNLDEGAINGTNDRSAFQNSYSSPIGRNPYPENPLKVSVAKSGQATLGVTLAQTLSIDENNEQLLFNPVKKDELNAVLSGQTVPVLTKGLITVHENGIADPTVSNPLTVGAKVAANQGKFIEAAAGDKNYIGRVLGTGSRGGNHQTTSMKGAVSADVLSGKYYLIKLDC
tara:strand:- start:2190 stop:2849 length:660 start_codon:yes stop_codon:yes gene_type:complete